MTAHPHIEALRTRHRELDARIKMEERSAAADSSQLKDLKRQKLRLKDEIASFQAG